MASSKLQLANKRFEFDSKAYGDDKFAVVEMQGYEALSKPFRFTLTLVSDDAIIDFEKMLSNPATFRIYAPDGTDPVPYHGVLEEFDQLHRADGYIFYRAVLVPRLWRLSLYRISEVYLNEKSIPDTLEAVLKNGRLTTADYEMKLSGSYRPRSFVCQFQETHLDFLSRWMEKEGMYYYFDHSGTADKLVVVDSRTMHDASALRVDYRPADELETGHSANAVQDFVCRQRPLPYQVVLQDFNYRKAAVQLKVNAIVSEQGVGDVMLYGENFRDADEGNRYAKLRAEEILCGAKTFFAQASAVGVRSGYFLQLDRHYRNDFNGRYLVTEVEHRGSQAGALLHGMKHPFASDTQSGETSYHNSFRAIPAALQFRPERITAKPRVAGTLNATIDSEGSGEYAELDEYGQYKVQLPFDQTDKNANKGSARIRMASPYAGSDHGMHFPLHKNAEVLLSFIDGDPDQPVIVGAVPNSENPNVVRQDNAHENRISTAGGNQLYMGDAKDKEVIWLHSPFHNSSIGIGSIDPKGGGSLWTSTVGSSESLTVGVANSITLGAKNTVVAGVQNNLNASISNNFSLGANVGFALSSDMNWKTGRNVTLDDTETVSLKTDAKLLATDACLISGGQRAAVKDTLEKLKGRIKYAVRGALALNAATAAYAGTLINDNVNSATGKSQPVLGWHPNLGTTLTLMSGAVSGAVVHGLLANSANAIAEAVKKDETYVSNMKIDSAGIKLDVDNLVPKQNSTMFVEPAKISMSAHAATTLATSKILIAPTEIKLSANGVAAQETNLELDNATAQLFTQNPTGSVTLIHKPSNGSAKLTADGFYVKYGSVKINAETTQGASMSCGRNSISATLQSVVATSGPAELTLSPATAKIELAQSSMELTAAGLRVNGTMIQLG